VEPHPGINVGFVLSNSEIYKIIDTLKEKGLIQ